MHFYICEERKRTVLFFIILSFSSNILYYYTSQPNIQQQKKKNIPPSLSLHLNAEKTHCYYNAEKNTYANISNITHRISMVPVCDHRCWTAYVLFPACTRSCDSKLNAWFLLSVRLFLNLPMRLVNWLFNLKASNSF